MHMTDDTLKIFRRLIREAQKRLASETIPARREELERLVAARRMDLERHQQGPKFQPLK
jgi:hypothetical protein